MKQSLIAFSVLFSLLATSCSKDTEGIETNDGKIHIKSNGYNPSSVTVGRGTRVEWVNDDSNGHSVTSDNGLFDSMDMLPGATFNFTFSDAGTYRYHCMYHSSEKGTVVVN